MTTARPGTRSGTSPESSPESNPTVRKILLGAELRRLREARGVSREAAGREIRASDSKISRIELGRVGFKQRDVEDLLTLYGVTGEAERDALLTMAREANAPGWWHHYTDVLPSWFEAYVGLEAAAERIRAYEVQFVPGLFQTEAYATAVTRLGHAGATPEEVERRVRLRMTRQQLLERPGPPQLWAVVDEAALHRPIGGPDVMRDQLEHLIRLSERPNITLQVATFDSGGHAAEGGAFTILRFPEKDMPDVVYVEQLTSALYVDGRAEVDHYLEVMELLCVSAPAPEVTPEILSKIRKEY